MKNTLVLFSLLFLCTNFTFGQKLGHSSISPYAGSVKQESHTLFHNVGETYVSRVDQDGFTTMNGLLHNQSVEQFVNSYIQVKFYLDENQNGSKDPIEPLLSFGAFNINGEIFTNFEEQGVVVIVPDGNFEIEYDSFGSGGYELTSQSDFSISINENQKFGNVEFGLYREPFSDISIKMVSTPFRCFYPVDYRVCVMNYGTETEEGVFWLKMDSRFENISYNWEPDYMMGDSTFVGWDMVIEPGELIVYRYSIKAPGVMEPTDIGVEYYTRCWTDTDLGFSEGDLTQSLDCAYDPNDKLVSPDRPDSLALLDVPISYTIRFQNTGNAYAENIVVRDTISQSLDMNTFRLIDTSHPDQLNVAVNPEDNHIINFEFDKIFLPDSTENWEASNGFILYEISAKEDTPINTEINNTAHIYFDFNPAIVTNTTSTTMVDTFPIIIPVKEVFLEEQISLYPNPTKGLVQFDKLVNQVKVRDIYGRIVQVELSTKKFDLSSLPTGTYFLEIFIDEQKSVEKLILMK